MSDTTTHERLAAWLDGEAALYRERAQRAEDAQDWDPAVRYAGAADALVQLRDRVLLGEQIGPSPARQGRCRPGQNGGLAAIRAAVRSGAQGEVWREVDGLLARLERFEYDAAGESEEYWRVVAMRDRIAAARRGEGGGE